jgi:hypothetical protein
MNLVFVCEKLWGILILSGKTNNADPGNDGSGHKQQEAGKWQILNYRGGF